MFRRKFFKKGNRERYAKVMEAPAVVAAKATETAIENAPKAAKAVRKAGRRVGKSAIRTALVALVGLIIMPMATKIHDEVDVEEIVDEIEE